MSRRGRRELFATICAFAFLVNFGRVAFAPLVEPFMQVFQVGEGTAGLVATAVWLGSALPRLPTGYLLTRVGRHHAIAGTGAVLVLAAAATSLAPTITLLAAGALCIGLATGVFYIAANPLVSELYPERVGWAVGLRGMSSQLAAVSAPLLVGLALALGTWRFVFRGLAAVTVVGLVAFALAARRADLPEAGAEDRDLLGAARAQWRLVLSGVALIGVTGFVWQGTFNFYVPYLVRAKGVAPGTARQLLSVTFAAGVPAFALSGRVADRVPYLPLMFLLLGGFVAAMLALTATTGVLAIAAVSLVLGVIIHGFFPVIDTYLLASLPDRHRASAYAVYSATMMLLQAPGSVVTGWLVESGFGYDAVLRGYVAALAVLLVALLVLYRLGRLPTGGR